MQLHDLEVLYVSRIKWHEMKILHVSWNEMERMGSTS